MQKKKRTQQVGSALFFFERKVESKMSLWFSANKDQMKREQSRKQVEFFLKNNKRQPENDKGTGAGLYIRKETKK